MDNKITKKRLSNLFAYEWIVIIVAIALVVILWEFIFTVSAVRLSVGQTYKVLYDVGVSADNEDSLMKQTLGALSYDVLDRGSEQIQDLSQDMLYTRLTLQDGDVLFTSLKEEKSSDDNTSVRAKTVIDRYKIYNYERLLLEAKEYLSLFLKDDFNDYSNQEKLDLAKNFDNLSQEKIDDCFTKRMKGDNRFKTKSQIENGKILERTRIKRLCKDVVDFEKLLSSDIEGLFFRYTKGKQDYDGASENNKSNFLPIIETEIMQGRENAIYGLNLAKLPEAQNKPQVSQVLKTGENADDLTLLVFDFKSYQPDLQYESITFIVETVRFFSDILN